MGQVISNVYSFPSYSSLPCGTRVANLVLLSAPLMQRELVDRGGRNLGTLLQLNLEGDLSCWRKREKFTIRESSLPIPRIVVTLSLADWHMLQLCNCLSHQQGHQPLSQLTIHQFIGPPLLPLRQRCPGSRVLAPLYVDSTAHRKQLPH